MRIELGVPIGAQHEVDERHRAELERFGCRQQVAAHRRGGDSREHGQRDGRENGFRRDRGAVGEGDARPVFERQALHRAAQSDLRTAADGCCGEPVPEEPVAGPRIPEHPAGRAAGRGHPPYQAGDRVRRDAATRLLSAQELRLDPPDLPCVGEVEPLAHRRPEARAKRVGERVAGGPAQRREQSVPCRSEQKPWRQVGDEISRSQRERDPASTEPDPAVAHPQLQVGSEQRSKLGQDRGLDAGVQPVASEVHANAVDVEASGETADGGSGLEHGHVEAATRGPERGAETGRACAENHDPTHGHAAPAGRHPNDCMVDLTS